MLGYNTSGAGMLAISVLKGRPHHTLQVYDSSHSTKLAETTKLINNLFMTSKAS